LNFFRSEEEVRAWRRSVPGGEGAALVLAEAFELGRRVFGGLLAASRSSRVS
jgi:hypothetical protein